VTASFRVSRLVRWVGLSLMLMLMGRFLLLRLCRA
jgi:hypothetical protein